ncbi:MAG TPA: phosphate ABC transporter substrate-binding protein [Terriglobia bacterium]|nr:phosphate ABC transporter substrate-binding protein [Terriglobia bacterium]
MKTKHLYAVALSTLLFLLVSGCGVPPEAITVKGSDTMVPLGQRWAEIYMKEHPSITIQVTGGGSGTGIAALINGTTQICESSRPMKPEEKNSVKEQRKADVSEIPVALDALAVYLNNQNPIERLTMEQVAKIFKGEITNWKDVGGKDTAVVLYGRENNSGTYVFFKEHVLENKDFAEKYQPLPGTAAVINAVTKDAAGIGYGGIGYAKDVKTISIAKTANAEPIAPKMENVLNNSYPLSRQLFWYLAGPPSGEIKNFVDWVLSPAGQKIVNEVGYYPLKPDPAASQ